MTSAVAPATAGRAPAAPPSRARVTVRWLIDYRAQLLAGVAAAAITIGGLLHLAGADTAGHQVWRAAVALLAAELSFEVARTVIVDRHLGVDTIALVAMVGALALGEELAGAVIGLMFSGGAALEAVASRRARRELTLIEAAAAPLAAVLGTAGGIAAGHGVLSWIVNENMPETMPDIGTLIAVAPLTYALAAAAGTVVVAAAPLLTVRRLRDTDISATLRVVE